MTANSETPTETWIAVGAVFLSIAVIPGLVFWTGIDGWHTESRASMVAFGFLAMLPGVLLGGTSLLVMLGRRSSTRRRSP